MRYIRLLKQLIDLTLLSCSMLTLSQVARCGIIISMVRFVLIDGNAIMHRAFHALPPLTNRSGELLNAVYGFSTMLLKVIADLKPDYLAVAFDTPAPTFRKMLYLGYQAKRPVMDEGLSGQFPYAYEVVKSMGVTLVQKEGYEADDVIGTLAQRAVHRTKGIVHSGIDEVVIVTGDRDLYQLVNEKVKIYGPVRGLSEAEMFDEKRIEEKMGVRADQIVDYKGLVGDGSDNYPGVAGIGPKTAVNLIREFGDLGDIYRNLDKAGEKFGEKVKEKLIKGEELGKLSYKLATIVKNVPLSVKLDKCRFEFNDQVKESLANQMRQLGFKSIAERLEGREKQEARGPYRVNGKRDKKKGDGQLGLL